MNKLSCRAKIRKHIVKDSYLSKEDFESMIFKDLALSLSEEMLKDQKLPIPTSYGSDDEYLEYSLSLGVCSIDEMRTIHKQLEELKVFKEVAKHYQDIVDRTLVEQEIERLLGE